MKLASLLRPTGLRAAASWLAIVVIATGALLQRERGGWPFGGAAAMAAATDPVRSAAVPADSDVRVGVDVDPAQAAALGVRLIAVTRESLTETIHAPAVVVPDESRIHHVHTRVAGWVERLEVSITGQPVRAGQVMAQIFSQELLSSQTEYLAARRMAAGGLMSAVLAGGRTRLGVFGMTAADIDAIERSGQPLPLVPVLAPRGGVVINRGVTVGTSVDPSTELFTIADLSRVWVFAEVPEAHISAARVGLKGVLEFPAAAPAPIPARIEFVHPTLTEQTRTLRVRLSLANPRGLLKPGVYGTAAFDVVTREALVVPRDAVVDTGRQQHVFVASGNRYEPRAVVVGTQLADRIEILQGLAEGEQIVAAGVFLLDSESRLRATGGMGGHNHGSPSETPPPAADPHANHPRVAPAPPPVDPHAGHKTPVDPHAGHRE